MFTKDFISCVHVRCYFFTAAHFQLAANISHFLAAAMKFSCFSSNEIRLLAPSLSIKNNVEKDTILLFFFSSVAFGLSYLLIEIFYIGVPVVRTDGRSVGRSGGVRSRNYQIF